MRSYMYIDSLGNFYKTVKYKVQFPDFAEILPYTLLYCTFQVHKM